jgi:hypothetical protein
MKISQQALKRIITEEIKRALKESYNEARYYGLPRLISPDIEEAFAQAEAACKQGVLATMECNGLSFSCVKEEL